MVVAGKMVRVPVQLQFPEGINKLLEEMDTLSMISHHSTPAFPLGLLLPPW